jgi:multiple sugar transport system ATP-binding protein
MPMAHVVLKDLVKTYGSFKAVNDVSLTVNDGEFVALVGPSGCGKTTTLNLIAGLIPITSGDIVIGDQVVNDLDPKDRDIAMVFQNYALYPQKSVYKNLAFPLQMRKLPQDEIDKKVKEAARVLDITHLLERRPRELSGGQQQRVALGRALVRDPRVPDGRAALQSRRQAARADALGDQALPPGSQGDDHLRDARPARSRDHGRQDGGDERRLLQQYDSPAQVFRPSGEHVRRELRRQPGDEPDSAEASTANGSTC